MVIDLILLPGIVMPAAIRYRDLLQHLDDVNAVVKDLEVSTQFPHGMRIRVIERPPVATVSVAGRTIAVASDGTLLHDLTVKSPAAV